MREPDTIPIMNSITRPGVRVLRADAAANRQRLLDAAAELFAKESVTAVHMEQIARLAGVGKGTLYRHFQGKGDLALALLEEVFTTFQNEALAQMRCDVSAGTAWLEQLALFLSNFAAFMETHMTLMCEIQRGGVDDLNSPAPYAWLHITIRNLLQMAVAAGECSTDLDIPVLADMLLAPVTAQFYRFLREQRSYAPERINANLQTMVFSLGKRSF